MGQKGLKCPYTLDSPAGNFFFKQLKIPNVKCKINWEQDSSIKAHLTSKSRTKLLADVGGGGWRKPLPTLNLQWGCASHVHFLEPF